MSLRTDWADGDDVFGADFNAMNVAINAGTSSLGDLDGGDAFGEALGGGVGSIVVKGASKLVVIADNGWGTSLSTATTNTPGTSEALYNVGLASTDIVAAYNHWYTDATVNPHIDADPAGPITFSASVRIVSSTNPGTVVGTIYRLTFNGRTSVTLDPGGRAESDPVGISVAPGDVVAIRTYLSSGTAYCTQKTWGTYTSNGGFASGDLTAPGSSAITPSNGNYFIPSGVLGYPVGASMAKSVLLLGNSIGAGLGDFGVISTLPKISAGGFGQRALTGVAGFVNASVGGDYAQNFQNTAASFHRLKGVIRCNTAIIEYGSNDINLGGSFTPLTAIQLQVVLLDIANRLRRLGIGKVFVITILPRVTTTDNMATTTNQTPLSTESQRVAHNTWVRAGCPIDPTSLAPVAVGTFNALTVGSFGHPFTGFFDTAARLESSLNSGFWKPCKRVTTASITSGGDTITSAGASFQSAALEAGGDLGSAFALFGASTQGVPAALIANLAVISSATQALCGAVATSTVTNAQMNIGIMTSDGIHPSSDGYDLMSKAIDPSVL